MQSAVSRSVRRVLLGVVDRGWCGLQPLKTHVVICGFPRSGSTLLQVMVERCIRQARTFRREYPALLAAQIALRNHPVMITKLPRDLFQLDELRAFYANRSAKLRCLVMVRDPRAVLTSRHVNSDTPYYVDTERWRRTDEAYRRLIGCEDIHEVRFEELIRKPDVVQERLKQMIGWEDASSFSQVDQLAAEDDLDCQVQMNLNGLRPLDPGRVTSWQDPVHRDRIRQLLDEMPELPGRLIEMGYEADAAWTAEYASGRGGTQPSRPAPSNENRTA